MDTLVFWLLERLGGRAIWKHVQKILGWFLGARYRSLRDDIAALERNPGNGEAAARLITRAQPFGKVVSIFNDFRLAPKRIAEIPIYVAMINRLQDEGPTPATVEYLKCGNDEDDYDRAIDVLTGEAEKDVPGLGSVLVREATEKLDALRYPKDEDGNEQDGRR